MTSLITGLSSRERIKESGKPAVIYGMGNGADRVIDEFETLGIPVLGVTASDDFVRGQTFRGFTVKKLSCFDGDFILCIAFGTQIDSVISHIMSLREKYEVIVPVEPVYGDEIFDRAFVRAHSDEIDRAYELFTPGSKRIYKGCLDFMFSGDLGALFSVTTPVSEAFENILRLSHNESCLDLGAYRGDTVESFLARTGGRYREIIAVEPDEKNYSKLAAAFPSLDNFTAVNAAVSDRAGTKSFAAAGGRQSRVADGGKQVRCVTVDELCAGRDITYIKADIEGEEKNMLLGARETIARCKPKLNIALYHKSRDIFEIPLLVNEINPEYRFEIRRHPYIPCWDMNLYCV